MKVTNTIAETRAAVKSLRQPKRIAGLVPTMGALHKGHLELIDEARRTCDLVVVTIFVNPTQFGPNEDFSRYPKTIEADIKACRDAGVDVVFCPETAEMYPDNDGPFIHFGIERLADHLCGASRPGHFNGVLQVVNKLFNIVQPDHAWFGQKDIQQFILIETMVREFDIPVQIHRGLTVRQEDGLALSSRNRYLDEAQRKAAPQLNHALHQIMTGIAKMDASADGLKSEIVANDDGTWRVVRGTERPGLVNVTAILEKAASALEASGFKIDYLSVSDYRTLHPATDVVAGRRYIVAGAAWLGTTRLIDNEIFEIQDLDHDH
jgi:pantoate--beta-alanine ligase